MSNICATILAIASLIGIFVACAVKEPGIMIFLCAMYFLLYLEAVSKVSIAAKIVQEDKDDEKRSPLLGEEDE